MATFAIVSLEIGGGMCGIPLLLGKNERVMGYAKVPSLRIVESHCDCRASIKSLQLLREVSESFPWQSSTRFPATT